MDLSSTIWALVFSTFCSRASQALPMRWLSMRWRPALLMASLKSVTWARAGRARPRALAPAIDIRVLRCMVCPSDLDGLKLAGVNLCVLEVEPGIGFTVQRKLQAFPQGLAAFVVFQNAFLHIVQAHTVHVMHGALQVPAFLAVQLAKRAGVLQHFGGSLHLHQKVRHLGLDAAVAGDVHLPARVHTDHAHVLDACLGAVARAAGDGELDLVRCVHAPHRALQVLAHLGAVLRAHAAPFAAHAGLHRAQGLGVGVAGGHADVFPDADQVFFLHAQQVDALAAGDLDGGDLVLVGGVGDAAQLVGRGFATPHARDDGIGAVLLDVGVAAFVDEAALWVVLGFLGPAAGHVVVQGGAAAGAAVGRFPAQACLHIGNGQVLVGHNGLAYRLVAKVGAAAHGLGLGGGGVVASGGEHDDLFHQAGAGATRCASLGVFFHLIQREQALVADRLADGALGHAVAAANLVAVGHGRGLVLTLVAHVADVGAAFAKHQLVADVGNAAAIAQQLEVPAAVHRVAVHAGAHQLVVLDDQLFVNAAKGVAHHDFFGAFAALELTGTEQINAGHFQLGGSQRAGVAANAVHGQVVGGHFGLLKQRGHQAVGDAAVGRAFPDAVDARVGHGLHGVGHHNAAVHMQAHAGGQLGVGANAHSHHHQIGRDFGAILELDGLDAAIVTTH